MGDTRDLSALILGSADSALLVPPDFLAIIENNSIFSVIYANLGKDGMLAADQRLLSLLSEARIDAHRH